MGIYHFHNPDNSILLADKVGNGINIFHNPILTSLLPCPQPVICLQPLLPHTPIRYQYSCATKTVNVVFIREAKHADNNPSSACTMRVNNPSNAGFTSYNKAVK